MTSSTKPLMDPWRDAFLLRLRLRDVTGAAIGDALAQVDAHCAESGDQPKEAFGEAVTYADSLVDLLPRMAPVRAVRAALVAGATTIGVGAVLAGASGAARSTPGELRAGALGVAVLVGFVTAMFVSRMEQLLEGRTRWILGGVFALCLGVGVAAPVLLPVTLVRAPGIAMAVAGVLVLALAWLPWLPWSLVRRSPAGRFADRVIDPRTGEEPFVLPRWVGYMLWTLPIVLLAVALTMILVPGRA